jgi:sec-independent protein translocase protein TatC
MTDGEKRLSILGHLSELRKRLIRSVIAVAIATIVAFAFARQIFDILTFKSSFLRPAFNFLTERMHLFPPPDFKPVFIDITEMIGTYMKVCLFSGIILAMPYLIYELVMFVSPALTPKERKRFVYTALPWVGLMFLVGVFFAYFILLPPAMRFLTTFGSDIATPQIRIGTYVSTVSRLLLAVGLIFELPVLTTFLAWMGIISSKWLADKRKWAIILAFITGAIITPTLDPINQTLVALPIIVLFELSIWLAKLVQKKRADSV